MTPRRGLRQAGQFPQPGFAAHPFETIGGDHHQIRLAGGDPFLRHGAIVVEALHRVLQSGGANGAIGRGMLSGHQGIHSAVAENKQHPLSNRLRWNGGDLLLKLLARVAAEPRFKSLIFTPRGGGTGTNGQALNGGIIVDMSRYMNRIIEINPEEGWVRVEAGVIKDQLNQFLKPYGYFFAPELSTSNRATLGENQRFKTRFGGNARQQRHVRRGSWKNDRSRQQLIDAVVGGHR